MEVLVIVTFTMVATLGINAQCPADKFDCGPVQPKCIVLSDRCNGHRNCPDGSDEFNCGAKCAGLAWMSRAPALFNCTANGECVRRCDGRKQCNDSSDEIGCNKICYNSEFHCGHVQPKCIDFDGKCDGDEDCTDGSDEIGCNDTCSDDGFHCIADGYCLQLNWRCDGFRDCPTDGSDEKGCNGQCYYGSYHCGDVEPKCLSFSDRCNGHQGCTDGSDEKGCNRTCRGCGFQTHSNTDPNCDYFSFHCGDLETKCIVVSDRCNGYQDCSDGSDEFNCAANCTGLAYPGGAPLFSCTTNGECVRKCDGTKQCKDSSDEIGCNGKCFNGIFHCGDVQPKCVTSTARCDGRKDCPDGSDEIGCNGKCLNGRFHCGDVNPKCLSDKDRCDGYQECRDGSDEFNCGVNCTGSAWRSKGGPPLFNCTANGECVRKCDGMKQCNDSSDEIGCDGKCYNGGFHCGDANPKCLTGKHTCDGLQECRDGRDEFNCGAKCTGSAYRSKGGPPLFNCTDNQQCVRGCDGKQNCNDGGDEIGCNGTCWNGRFHCGGANPKCLSDKDRCDGFQECRDGSDEFNCGAKCTGFAWRSKGGPPLFNCTDNRECVRGCDGKRNCNDGSDEVGC